MSRYRSLTVAGKRTVSPGVLLAALFALARCAPIDDGFNPEDWNWDAGSGKVYIRIALNTPRFALALDNPTQEQADYFEAVFKEQGSDGYYTGAASAGESYIAVAVPYGKTYDVLVLAGTPANGQVSNGVKVLLASGFASYPVVYGQNILSVPMTLHNTTDSLTWNETTKTFTYQLTITGVSELLNAKTSGNLFHETAPQAYLIPYPDPYSAAHQRLPITVSETAGSAVLTIPDTALPDAVKIGVTYRCYYNLTYYAFSDPSSGSSPWDVRRGVTNQMYIENTSYGGGIPLSYCYYVKADGSDADAGYLREQPFKTLAKAIKEIRAETIPWIKTIAVLGTLDEASESSQTDTNYKENNSVFAISNPQAGEYAGLIRITGYPSLTDGLPAVLSGENAGKRVLYITGADTNIQFDHIKITGGFTSDGGGMWIANAHVTLKDSLQINDNEASMHGGGVYLKYGDLIMEQGSSITGNRSTDTGKSIYGVYVTGVTLSPGDYLDDDIVIP